MQHAAPQVDQWCAEYEAKIRALGGGIRDVRARVSTTQISRELGAKVPCPLESLEP